MTRNKIIINKFYILAVIAMMLIPLALLKTEDGDTSKTDDKPLVNKPVLGQEGYQKSMESWFNDKLGLREEIVLGYSELNDKVFGELINKHYQYGRDGWTFLKIHNNISYSSYHMAFADMVADIQRYCESRGTKFYYVFSAEKESVYREHLPVGVNYSDEWADHMLSYMKSKGVNCIDLRESLAEAKKKENVFSKVYDPGHWNHNGAFYGMKTITEAIHEDMPRVKVLEKDEYDITAKTIEKNYGSIQTIIDKENIYSLKSRYKNVTGDMSDEVIRDPNHSYFSLIRNNSENAKGIKRLLVFQDNLYAPFIFSRAKETAIVRNFQNIINFDYYYNIFKPEVVIFENMEYVVKDAYFNEDAMKAADYNPAIVANYPESGFAERREELLSEKEATEYVSKPKVIIVPGKSIDRLFLSRGMLNTKYAYLITDSRVIDLKRNDNDVFAASVRNGTLTGSDSAVILYTISKDGEHRYQEIPVVGTDNFKSAVSVRRTTKNATADNRHRKYVMTTKEDDNAFSYVTIHLFDNDIQNRIATISKANDTGNNDGFYCHTLQTGDFALLLRAGNKNFNEWTAFDVHLEKNKCYRYTYNVEELSDKRAVISDFDFFELAETGEDTDY